MVIEPEGKKSAITDSVLAEIWDNEKDATYDQEEKPPIMNEGEREKYGCHTRSMSGIEVMRQQPRINITGALEAQRDDTWQKASLIYEAKIEKAKAEGAREIIDWVENNIKTICIYGEDFPKFEFDWQALKARFGGK